MNLQKSKKKLNSQFESYETLRSITKQKFREDLKYLSDDISTTDVEVLSNSLLPKQY